MPSTPSQKPKPAAGVVKHRACDECRTRKLACSKEPEGCSRCRREGLRCIYSPQKPMGRPRKRRHVEDEGQSSRSNSPPSPGPRQPTPPGLVRPQPPQQQPPHQQPPHQQPAAAVTLDTNFSFLDADTSGINYLDLLSPLGDLPPSTLPPELIGLPTFHEQPVFTADMGFGASQLLGEIDFAENDSADEDMSRDITDSVAGYLASYVPEGLPKLSQAASTPESTPSPMAIPFANTSCSCLSEMYLALEALAALPPDVSAAMRVARNAARVSHNVVHCPSCSLPMLRDVTAHPPMQAFQNMMMLGALIPAAANAYARILEMVDATAQRARADARKITFNFHDYGGLWGELNKAESSCETIRAYDNREMDPDSWRLATRALLRIDIYGFNFQSSSTTMPVVPHYHVGLRDVINQLEERSRIRHDKLDALAAAGHPMYSHLHFMQPPDNSKENRQCLKIIEMARIALDKLVIA